MVSIMHEIGHTLGYIHTQSRIDRNSYVSIVTDNIQQDFIGNFFMWTYGTIRFSDVNFPYEYGSMMHYEAYAFSNNNQPTIIPYDSRYEKTMGQRDRATFYDYKQINRLYCMRQGIISNRGNFSILIQFKFAVFLFFKIVHRCSIIMIARIMVILIQKHAHIVCVLTVFLVHIVINQIQIVIVVIQ